MPRTTSRQRPLTPPAAPAGDAAVTAPRPRNTLRVKVPKGRRFVALAGNIGAGKTTAAKLISQSFGYQLAYGFGETGMLLPG